MHVNVANYSQPDQARFLQVHKTALPPLPRTPFSLVQLLMWTCLAGCYSPLRRGQDRLPRPRRARRALAPLGSRE